jgi:hypothetical protein
MTELALTLPKATSRPRLRIKKPRKPTRREAYALLWLLFSVVYCVLDLVLWHSMYWYAFQAMFAIYWWNEYRRARKDRPNFFYEHPMLGPPYIAAIITFYVVGLITT